MHDKYFPSVAQVLAGEDYTVYAYFTDGTVKIFDVKPLIASGGVFEQLRDKDFFQRG